MSDAASGVDSSGSREGAEMQLEELYGQRLDRENDLINQRMSWLLTFNSFLIGGTAVLIANQDKFSDGYGFIGSVLAIGIVGSLSSASCLFANLWGAVARIELTRVLVASWKELDPSVRQERRSKMRMYGLDPRSAVEKPAPKPSRYLHPGYLLPALFMTLFAAMPVAVQSASEDVRGLPWEVAVAPLWLLLTFVVVAVSDFPLRRLNNPRTVGSDEPSESTSGASGPAAGADAAA